MRIRFSILALLVGAAGLAGQTPAAGLNANLERMTNDRYTRSHDYDLLHQRIALRDFNWDSTTFTGSVVTTLVALRPGLDSVILDAGPRLAIRRVADAGHAALRHLQHGDTLVIYLPRTVAFHDSVRFTIDYDGKVDNGSGLTFIDERPHTPRQIWSQGEDHNNHFWFPTYDFPNDKLTWEMVVTVPAGYTAVSNGRLVSDRREPTGERTMDWRQDEPSASYLVSLIIAPLAKVHDTWRGTPVDYYVYHEDSVLARALFRVTPDMIEVYSRLTGVPYPWAKYAQTTVADFFGGMENVSATTLVDWIPDPRAYQDRPWYQYILIPHELAHQWFGDYVTTENWANMWLNEGFAEFLPGQYWRQKLGAHAEEDYYLDEYRQFTAIDARSRMPLAALGSNNIYPKGALVLEMLERYLGEDRFWAGVHRYLTRNAFSNAITDDLRHAFLEATGEDLAWFWDEWMYSAGYPEFVVSAAYDSVGHQVRLTVRQTQRDTLKADSTGLRYVTPEAFRMPVVVRVGTADGDVVRHAWVARREDTIVVDSVRSAPRMVVFDADNGILKALTFAEPTEWLTTQLRSDPDLWNRNWVIQQLARRRDDAAAGAALVAAATGADYFLTRAQAAAALAAFPANLALQGLEAAMRDTSSQVRAAAASALGVLGGSRAEALVSTAWRSDPSYQVRAEALRALVQLDTASRRDAIATALTMPSYQHAIQNAALGETVRMFDTTFVDRIQELAGEQPVPAEALGALAAGGSQRALDRLEADLDDGRPWVRHWALAALTRRLGPARALPVLTRVQASLRHADARRAVGQAIERLERAAKRPK